MHNFQMPSAPLWNLFATQCQLPNSAKLTLLGFLLPDRAGESLSGIVELNAQDGC
jgi:hypothetical protein